jgi:protease I
LRFDKRTVKANRQMVSLMTRYFSAIVMLALLFSGCRGGVAPSPGKKVVIVRAPQYCCDEELFRIRAVLKENNIGIVIASTTLAEAVGERLGIKIKPDMTMHEVEINKFDGIVIGSGRGCKEILWKNENLKEMVKLAYAQNKLVAAGCNAPVVLARAGVLKGRRATVFPNPENITELEYAGAIYTNEPVVVDRNIITSRDLLALKDFAKAIVEATFRQVLNKNKTNG